ncbi:unnamed protein product [Mytilus edulis]|uniref:Uncharacterized protein n=1 Tax=Mytilus edulis TaxID=6550 RepID=A0A8S3R4H5_MYTED|nr:unnamed protein product [Mytilus edulis]
MDSEAANNIVICQKRSREIISDATLTILEEAWNDGLRSTKEKEKIQALGVKTNLSTEKIEVWIGNRRAKDRRGGVAPAYSKKKVAVRGPSSYTLFSQQFKREGSSKSEHFQDVAKKWRELSPTERERFQEDARGIRDSELKGMPEEDAIAHHFKQIRCSINILESMGFESVMVATREHEDPHLFGTNKGLEYIVQPHVMESFRKSVFGNTVYMKQPSKKGKGDLRTEVRQILNSCWDPSALEPVHDLSEELVDGLNNLLGLKKDDESAIISIGKVENDITKRKITATNSTKYDIDYLVEDRDGKLGQEFLVHWKGYSPDQRTWEPVVSLPTTALSSGAKVSSKLSIRPMSAPNVRSVLIKTEKVPTVDHVGMGTTLPQNICMSARNAIPVSGYNQKSQTEGKTITGEEFAQAQTPVKHNLPVFVTLRQQLNVKLSRNECMNIGSCMKVDNTLGFADYFDKKLIIRKTDVAEVFYIPMPYRPCYITDIDSNTVAVTCTLDRFILIINLSTGEVTSTIETSDCLLGISYYDNNLYVVIGRIEKQMHVMDLMGNVIRMLPLGTIRGITVHRDRLVCIEPTTINCFTLDGKLLRRFENEKYRNLNRVITDNDGNVYVTDENTNTVVVVYDDGRHYGDILTGSDELCKPAGIHFDKKQNSLIVCNRQDGKAFLLT